MLNEILEVIAIVALVAAVVAFVYLFIRLSKKVRDDIKK
jgi:Ca2+/Na+ antiporter